MASPNAVRRTADAVRACFTKRVVSCVVAILLPAAVAHAQTGTTFTVTVLTDSTTGIAANCTNQSTLGNHGGPTETMLPLPGSVALCALNSTATGVDQRGLPRVTSYGAVKCQDTGAVQTNYGLSFTQQPASLSMGAILAPAPAVQLVESGQTVAAASVPISIAASAGTLNGAKSQSTTAAGVATFSDLTIGSQQIADTLIASINVAGKTVSATSGTFDVRGLPTTVTLRSSGSPVLIGSSVTLTATVASTAAGTPDGSVNFFDGTTPIGTISLSGGVAAMQISNLTVGTHTLTAVYAGNGTFAGATGTAVSQTVQDFTLTGSGAASVTAGGSVDVALMVSPTAGTTLPAAVTLTVSGLPSGATSTFSPTSVGAGAAATNVTLTIKAPVTTAGTFTPRFSGGEGFVAAAIVLLVLPGARKLRRGSLLLCSVWSLLAAGTLLTLSGCGAAASGTSSTAKTYPVTVTAASGTVTHTFVVTLTAN